MNIETNTLQKQLLEASEECSARGLLVASKWAAEQLYSLTYNTAPTTIDSATPNIKQPSLLPPTPTHHHGKTTPTLKHRLRGSAARHTIPAQLDSGSGSGAEGGVHQEDNNNARESQWQQQDEAEAFKFRLAKSLFDLREFDRASFYLQDCTGPRAVFLRLYARYLGRDRRVGEASTGMDMTVTNNPNNSNKMPVSADDSERLRLMGEGDRELLDIRDELELLDNNSDLDSFGLYLLALVHKKHGQRDRARKACLRSIHMYEYNWSAWLLLESCVDQRELPIEKLGDELPNGWMRHAFLAHLLLEVFTSASEKFMAHYQVIEQLLPNSLFAMSLRAVRHYNMREFEEAGRLFAMLQKLDPYRMDQSDIHSNILYVMGDRARLGELARRCAGLDRFRPETCCVIGNYYSLRREHEKAVGYFQRAIQLDRGSLAAWVLMGHEYIEMKNTAAAIDAYRHAVDVDERDYRAWYGLGKTYEMLNMPYYALSYYKRAAALRPHDSRMWCALADCYELSGQADLAIDCYRRALLGSAENESHAVSKLAQLYRDAGDQKRAAYYYQHLYEDAVKSAASASASASATADLGTELASKQDELAAACLFLAGFEQDRGNNRAAQRYLAQVIDGASSGGVAQQEVEEAKAMMRAMASSDQNKDQKI